MGQVTIYLDEETERLVDMAARSAGVSKSKWVAEIIRDKAGAEWPEFVKSLAGAWPDLSEASALRKNQPKDARRERF